MSTEQIKLLESIRNGIELLGDKLGGQIGETNAKLGMMEVELGARIDVTNTKLGMIDHRLGNVERQMEKTHLRLDSITQILTDDYGSLSVRGDQSDKRMNALEQRVDKLEQTG
ncbi:MAG: hypothetical protein K2X29_04730 [Candidatus Obscuribacterales bacterium]|nr:hypothetical protein [Candidatus Obscuribacterales bacterium]